MDKQVIEHYMNGGIITMKGSDRWYRQIDGKVQYTDYGTWHKSRLTTDDILVMDDREWEVVKSEV